MQIAIEFAAPLIFIIPSVIFILNAFKLYFYTRVSFLIQNKVNLKQAFSNEVITVKLLFTEFFRNSFILYTTINIFVCNLDMKSIFLVLLSNVPYNNLKQCGNVSPLVLKS